MNTVKTVTEADQMMHRSSYVIFVLRNE